MKWNNNVTNKYYKTVNTCFSGNQINNRNYLLNGYLLVTTDEQTDTKRDTKVFENSPVSQHITVLKKQLLEYLTEYL